MCGYCGCESIDVVGRFMREHVEIINATGVLRRAAEAGDDALVRAAVATAARPARPAHRGRGGRAVRRARRGRRVHRPRARPLRASTSPSPACSTGSRPARTTLVPGLRAVPARPHRPRGERPVPGRRDRLRRPGVGAGRRAHARAGRRGRRMSRTPSRAWLLLPAGLSLLAGLDAGLLLLEVPAPVGAAHLPDVHGPLMVLGFLGTLIALERAVALRVPARVRRPRPARARRPGPGRSACRAPSARCCCSTAASRSSPCSSRCGAAAATTPWSSRCSGPSLADARRAALGARGCRGRRSAARRLRRAHHRGRAGRAGPDPPAPRRPSSALVGDRRARRDRGHRRGALPRPGRARVRPLPARARRLAGAARRRPAHHPLHAASPGSAPRPCSPATRGSPWPGSPGPSPG